MADISIKYKGQEITSMNVSGIKKAKTAGKYCEDDITIEYTKPTVTFNTQSKTVTPTESTQDITPDSGYDGLDKVSVNAIPNNYVGSAIARRDATSLTANGATVSVPGGYYSGNVSKNVATATQATPSIDINSTGLITASATQTAGYVTAGTKSATQQLTTQAAKTVTPTKSEQTAVASGVYTTGAVKIAAIPANYIDTSDATATTTDIIFGKTAYAKGIKVEGSLKDSKGSEYIEYIPNLAFSNGLAVSGYVNEDTVLRKDVMIYSKISSADLGNAVAANVVLGQTFTSSAGLKVEGTLEIQKYYTGSADPSSSLGNDGDIYLKVG